MLHYSNNNWKTPKRSFITAIANYIYILHVCRQITEEYTVDIQMDIKVVDFSGIRTAADITPAVIDQLHEAFTTIGFVIITNHGVEEKVRTPYKTLLYRDIKDQC